VAALTNIINGGSTTVMLFTGSGTNDGPLGPFPASGRQLSLPFCEVRDYNSDGKVARAELYCDQVSMLVQLGHMPAPEG
jgi:hypothetical protein